MNPSPKDSAGGMMLASTRGTAVVSSRFMGLACLLLAGCIEHPTERVDFGAANVVGYIIKAQTKCAAVGQPNIAECAELPRSSTGERLAAMTAQDVYKTFQDCCYPDLGMSKCEALVEQAYQEAKSR
jgi:hypothetical protein